MIAEFIFKIIFDINSNLLLYIATVLDATNSDLKQAKIQSVSLFQIWTILMFILLVVRDHYDAAEHLYAIAEVAELLIKIFIFDIVST